MKEIYEAAKAALALSRKRTDKKIFVHALGRELRLRSLSAAEMAELLHEREGYAKWLKRVLYAAIPDLKAIAAELYKNGEIREYCEAADIFSDADKDRIFELLLEMAEGEAGFTLRDELKN